MNQVRFILALLAAFVFREAQAQNCCTNVPLTPGEIWVENGEDGKPPVFYLEGMGEITWASKAEVEISRILGTKTSLFARVWLDDKTFDKYTRYEYEEYYDEDSQQWYYYDYTYTEAVLRGVGPAGSRIFPVGNYVVRWRGWNPCGYGVWSVVAEFVVEHKSTITAELIDSPFTNEPNMIINAAWSNNVVATKHEITVKSGKKVVRKATVDGGYGYGSFYWYDWGNYGASYRDVVKNPSSELPDGVYTFEVRSYSPILKKWSALEATSIFQLQRPAAPDGQVEYTGTDFDGFFDKSTRPYFMIDYGNTVPPLWSYFDIQKKEGTKTKVVRREWVNNMTYGYGFDGVTGIGGGDSWARGWNNDLTPGEYIVRVQAWNGKGPGQSSWSGPITVTIDAPGELEAPDGESISYWQPNSYKWADLNWGGIPNAYAYEVQMFRGGKLFRKSPLLDSGKGTLALYGDNEVGAYAYWSVKGGLPDGEYTFKVRGVNKANPRGMQESPWSESSNTYVINNTMTKPVGALEVYAEGDRVSFDDYTQYRYSLERVYEVIAVGCSKFKLSYSDGFFSSISLPPGTYKWRFKSWNVWRGWSPWSDWSSQFEVLSPEL